MNCEQSQQLLIEFIEETLKPEMVRELETHLHNCAECRTEYKALQTTLARASETPVPQPDEAFWNAFPNQVLDAYKKQEQTAETPTQKNLIAETTATGKSLLQTISDWLLPNGWPQLVAQAMVVTIAIGGLVYWSFQPTSIQFDSARLQAQFVNSQNLANVVKQHTHITTESNTYSFGDKPAQADFFKTGTLYSESLVLLAGNDINTLQQHLILLGHELSNTPVNQRLNEIKATITKGAVEQSTLLEDIARLQPYLEKQAANQSEKDRLLFQLGSWLSDIKLAAVLNNAELLKQSRSATYLLDAVQKQNMPKGVITKFKQILNIIQSTSLHEDDYKKVLTLVNNIQLIMGQA